MSTNVTLAWDPPASLGGRRDLSYILQYQEHLSESLHYGSSVNGTTTVGTISGMYLAVKLELLL